MLVANPIHGVVFKRMLENEPFAKFFIGMLLDETILAMELRLITDILHHSGVSPDERKLIETGKEACRKGRQRMLTARLHKQPCP
jgi:hypothetical protein